MGIPQSPSTPSLYPQALQLKLYQAFIFSIPILFSIILFLLFYLFYLKRRASSLSPPPVLPRTFNQAALFLSSPCENGLKGDQLKDKLPKVVFDEDLKARDSLCCVCLGEFEMEEELLQVPSCKHVFHVDCIHSWLHSNSTCPLCRCSVVVADTKLGFHLEPSAIQPNLQQDIDGSNHQQQMLYSERQQGQQERSSVGSTVVIEGSSSTSTYSRACHEMDRELDHVLHIIVHNS